MSEYSRGGSVAFARITHSGLSDIRCFPTVPDVSHYRKMRSPQWQAFRAVNPTTSWLDFALRELLGFYGCRRSRRLRFGNGLTRAFHIVGRNL